MKKNNPLVIPRNHKVEEALEAAEKNGVNVLPVDSEHNAIFQCLEGKESNEVSRLILTASGGPFRQSSKEKIQKEKK